MKRRYILLGLVALATTAFGQKKSLCQLDEYLKKQDHYTVAHFQSSMRNSIHHTWRIYLTPDAMRLSDMTPEEMKVMLAKQDSVDAICQRQMPGDLETIRDIFANLRKETSANYMYEYHNNDADTCFYSLAFYDDDDEISSTKLGKYPNFVDWNEKAIFEYRRGQVILKTENTLADTLRFIYGNRALGEYYHVYSEPKTEPIEERKAFDIAAFKAVIQPTLESIKQLKGAKEYPVYWRHDTEYKDSLRGGLLWDNWRNTKDHAGITTGTHYLIPAQCDKEGRALYQKLAAVAHDYVNNHPEQEYYYSYYNAFPAVNELHYIIQTDCEEGEDDYYLGYYRDMAGLHIVSVTTKGELWIPKDWQKLKSWVNGTRDYLKEMEQRARLQEVAEAIRVKKWKIDITSMNTMRYGSRSVSPDFFLELRGDTLRSNLPYLGQAQVSPTLSPSIGLNFEVPVLNYAKGKRESKKRTEIYIDVRTREDTYHYTIFIDDNGDATIRVRSMNRDPISFDGKMVTHVY
ncbi:MAG: DUF4251 domain-containing protein [Prevotella sp.]|nr:DUF4251 domain-containing protein [Prevotella sp.]